MPFQKGRAKTGGRKKGAANKSTRERMAVLKSAIDRAGVDQSYVLSRLRENVERAMQAEPVLDRDGNPTGEYQYQGQVANRALELLGKEIGMFIDRKDVTVRRITDLTEAELVEFLGDDSRHTAEISGESALASARPAGRA